MQPTGLISALLDRRAEHGDRDDAAMDLGAYDEPEVEQALITIVTDLNEDEGIADAAAESLSEIWNRKDTSRPELVSKMHPAAKIYFCDSK